MGTRAGAESSRKKQLHYQAGNNDVQARGAGQVVRSGQTLSILGGTGDGG